MLPAEIKIAMWCRVRREEMGWSVEDLAERTGVSRGVILSVEQGIATTRIGNVTAVVQCLGGELGVDCP